MQRLRSTYIVFLLATMLSLALPCRGQVSVTVPYIVNLIDTIELTLEPGVKYELRLDSCGNEGVCSSNLTYRLRAANDQMIVVQRFAPEDTNRNHLASIQLYDETTSTSLGSILTYSNSIMQTANFRGNVIARVVAMNMVNEEYNTHIVIYTCDADPPIVPTVTDVHPTYASIDWVDYLGSTAWRVAYGKNMRNLTDTIYTTSPHAFISGLEVSQIYYFRIFGNVGDEEDSYCLARIHSLTTPCDHLFNNVLSCYDLNTCPTRAFTGDYSDPYLVQELVDYGAMEVLSRHTVIYPWFFETESPDRDKDIRTQNQLSMLAPGGRPSVRLGNWLPGGQAEALEYVFKVDTNVSDLLLFNYAVVMEYPNHSLYYQPKVHFGFYDSYNQEIDRQCYSTYFYAGSSSEGWNTIQSSWGSDVVWKDWTALGIDLSPLQDEVIYVRLENYDCENGGHYAYSYFTLENAQKTLSTSSCGEFSGISFTAPLGFSYRWYAEGDSTTLSTERTFHTDAQGVYYCDLTYLHSPSCGFTLKGVASNRYPWADFDSEIVGDSPDCQARVQFYDRSKVSTSPDTLLDVQQHVDSVWWDFGDGTFSSERNPIHDYPTNSSFQVKHWAFLANGMCADSVAKWVVTEDGYCEQYDTIEAYICPGDCYRLFDTLFCDPGVFDYAIDQHYMHLVLMQADTSASSLVHHVLESQMPWFYRGTYWYDELDSLPIHSRNIYGCDSLLHYSLVVHHDTTISLDTIVCHNAFPFSWHGYLFTQPGFGSLLTENEYGIYLTLELTVAERAVDTGSISLGLCEGVSLVHEGVSYDEEGTYLFHDFTPEGCDSLSVVKLEIDRFAAYILASPEMASYSQSMVHFEDPSNSVSRLWVLPDRTETARQFDYPFPMELDSVACWLFATDAMGCESSDSVTIHFDRHVIWAPNTFTPSENSNNEFRIFGEGIDVLEVDIFDRKGRIVACWHGIDGFWDGTYTGTRFNAHGGKECLQDAYVYRVRYIHQSESANPHEKVGTVLLLR